MRTLESPLAATRASSLSTSTVRTAATRGRRSSATAPLRRLSLNAPDVLTAASNGSTLAKRHDLKHLGNRAGYRYPGIDTRVDNGQVVVAPSMHGSGKRYEWILPAHPITEMPDWLFDALAQPLPAAKSTPRPPASTAKPNTTGLDPYLVRVLEHAASDVAQCSEGGRNQLLFSKSCTVFEYFIGEQLDHLIAWRAMNDAGLACGLKAGEVSSVLSKAWRKAQSSPPRRVPPKKEREDEEPPSPYAGWIDPGPHPAPLGLDADTAGKPKKTVASVMTVLSRAEEWRDVFGFNVFLEAPIFLRQPPQREQDALTIEVGAEVAPQDLTRAAAQLYPAHQLEVTSGIVQEAMLAVAQTRVVHPIRDYLASLTWDGSPRIDTFFSSHCGAADTPFVRGVARILFLSAVARVERPGCKVDTIVILEGPQGLKKSTALAALAGPAWFSDTPLMIGDKDAYQSLRGVWIYELGELAALKGREAERVKVFASSPIDRYRAARTLGTPSVCFRRHDERERISKRPNGSTALPAGRDHTHRYRRGPPRP